LLGFAGIAWFALLAANRAVIHPRGGYRPANPQFKTARVKTLEIKVKTPSQNTRNQKQSLKVKPPAGKPRELLRIARCRRRVAAGAR
jgi:hypothetical protein